MANTCFDFDGHIYHPTYTAMDDFGYTIHIDPSKDTIFYNFDYGMYDKLDYSGDELDFGY